MSVQVAFATSIAKEKSGENQYEYIVEFNKNSTIETLKKFEMALPNLSEITQVVFCVEQSGKIWSIGYCPVEGQYTIENLKENVLYEIDYLNSKKMDGENYNIFLPDLQLSKISIKSNHEISNYEFSKLEKLGCEISIKHIHAKNDIVQNNAWEHVPASSFTIKGSYHKKDTSAKKIYWYNQKTGKTTSCSTSATSPHQGDGNSRYSAGFKWQPNQVKVNFITDESVNKNKTTLKYKYNASNLKNLSVDSNETLEMEVLFYNYHLNSGVSKENLGLAYQQTAYSWTSDQPGAYLDTTFGDSSTSRAFCVGTKDATALKVGIWYEWSITGAKGTKPGYANDGRFRVSAQRGYYYYGVSDSFSVFSEEHEPTLVLGITSSQNWVEKSKNAWALSASGTAWTYDSSTDPVRS